MAASIGWDECYYRILDLNISLESDSSVFLERFDGDYGWFRVSVPDEGKRLNICSRLHDPEDPFLRLTRTVNEQTILIDEQSLKTHPSPLSFTLQRVVKTIFSEITDYVVLHAGVLEKDGRALMLFGPPGVGKSTLTLALLERGFRFLSDDFCPIKRGTGRVHPFPRSVWVMDPGRSGAAAKGRSGKRPIAPDRLPASVCNTPILPGWLVCLDPGEGDRDINLEAGLKEAGEQAFVRDMAGIEGVTMTRIGPDFSEWHIRYPSGKELSPGVRRVIQRHGEHIWNIYRSDRAAPDFQKNPVLIPLSRHGAAMRIMGELKQEPNLPARGGLATEGPGAFFMEVIGLLAGVACYRLTAGRLNEMIRHIEGLVYGEF